MIKATPAPGFKVDSLTIFHGYNLEGEQYNEYGTKQYDVLVVRAEDFSADGTYTIPAALVDGDISIDGQFASASATAINQQQVVGDLTFSVAAEKLILHAAKAVKVTLVDAKGRILLKEKIKGSRTLTLPQGVYVLNGNKVIVP